jgi:hypothetical protein
MDAEFGFARSKHERLHSNVSIVNTVELTWA